MFQHNVYHYDLLHLYIQTDVYISTQRVNYYFSWPPLPQLKARQFVYVTVRCFSS